MKTALTLLATSALLCACSKAPEAPVAATPASSASTASAASSTVAAHAASIDWVKPVGADIDAIFAKAKADNKPVFLYWGAVWCPPCNQIKATVFNRPDFIERSKQFVPVYLDGDTPGAQKLGTRFKVRGYPTMVLFKPDGTELTRLPGEVDAAQYMQVLGLGLVATHSVKDSLNAVLATGTDAATAAAKAAVTPDAWRMLAYYSWDTDEARLLPKKDVAASMQTLAQSCPPEHTAASARLALKAMTFATKEKLKGFDRAAALARAEQVLADTTLARDNFDVLVYYAGDIVAGITAAATPERTRLQAAWNAALDKLAADATLSKSDRLAAVQGKVALARIPATDVADKQPAKGSATAVAAAAAKEEPPLDAALVKQAREAAAAMALASTDKYERQAVIPAAADLLSDAGLLDESDALLKADMPKAVSPYYHMLVLAANAKKRGDTTASLDWAEKAYADSVGPATRMQWGTGYVTKVIDLTPQDAPRIAKAASAVIAELEAVPETFYERNRRSLEKMGAKLNSWNAKGDQKAVIKQLTAELNAVCAKLPAGDDARTACSGVFKPPAAAGASKPKA